MGNITCRSLSCLSAIICCFSSAAYAAEPQLYETGPSEESSYVRFVNATDNVVAITSSTGSAKIELNVRDEGRASHFFTVKAGSKLSATIQGNGRKVAVDVVGKAWEYITIAVLPDGANKIKPMQVKETPTDFNAMKSSLALFNLDAKCGAAVMRGGAKSSMIFDGIKPFALQRRLINPVKLSASIGCSDKGADMPADFPQFQAGERYSVFLLGLKNARQTLFVRDAN